MQEPSIYTRIIRGELPCYKIYEDEKTFAFLDRYPTKSGHTLVVPKKQVDKIYDLSDEDYMAVMATVKKVMRRQVEVYGDGYRSCLKVIGFDVPHVHVQVIPCKTGNDYKEFASDPALGTEEALAAVATKLAF